MNNNTKVARAYLKSQRQAVEVDRMRTKVGRGENALYIQKVIIPFGSQPKRDDKAKVARNGKNDGMSLIDQGKFLAGTLDKETLSKYIR